MSALSNIENFPDISFIDETTIEELQASMINDFQNKYKETTGNTLTLSQADPYRLLLNACALQIYQGFQYLDRAGKQSFLKYSQGAFLDNLAALKGIKRNPAAKARTSIRFTLSEPRQHAVGIPASTRVTNSSEPYFTTIEYHEIPIGQMSIEVAAECQEAGVIGNGFYPGEINTIVDPIPYIAEIENITLTEGGADIETDENLAERVYLAPSSYSCAGPDDAYEYWAKTFNSNVMDIRVTSPAPVEVDIRFILERGELPGETAVAEMQSFLEDRKIRPLTDKVTVGAPIVESYNIDVEYWINESNKSMASAIQSQVDTAIDNFILWQKSKIGRDINPSELTRVIVEAGAKRANVLQPAFFVIPDTSIAVLSDKLVRYRGVERD